LASEATGIQLENCSARLWSAAIEYIDIDEYVGGDAEVIALA